MTEAPLRAVPGLRRGTDEGSFGFLDLTFQFKRKVSSGIKIPFVHSSAFFPTKELSTGGCFHGNSNLLCC